MWDILIRGTVIDGGGRERVRADVAIFASADFRDLASYADPHPIPPARA